ncbi:xylose isomerase-like protein [Leucogyrophana mollusca]|uniref:Xylose isomerase-like protein n=1 Tax=Leucogyrophana mollusca TaxID=85980 RepID=A0ACB8BI65_9AGAM|nr:xylose isomerase-like protein [Leucogyrophana mollusca]
MCQSISSIQQCYATPSAGMHPSHTLPRKLRGIRNAGFTLTEIALPDLEGFAEQEHPGYRKISLSGEGDVDILCMVARKASGICNELGLKVLAMHPFSKFEGYEETSKREESFERAATWFKVLQALDCQILQVGSSDDPSSSPDLDVIARDLRQLADEADSQSPPIKIAYELWAWAAHVNTWEGAWEVCKRVDRPNFGLCLDTFQICARTYMNPAPSTDGADLFPISPGAPLAPQLSASLHKLTETLTAPAAQEKIFYFQISDASGPAKIRSADLVKVAAEKGISPLYAWSNAWRPLPYMEEIDAGKHYGCFMPVLDVIEAVLGTGWRGPWSYEVFYEEDMSRDDPNVPEKWARAAMESHQKILQALEPLHVGEK